MKKLVLAVTVLGLFGATATASASDPINDETTGTEFCMASNGDSCTYTSTRPGGYLAQGDWTLTVLHPDGTEVSYSDENPGEAGCLFYPAGVQVTVTAGPQSGIVAGNGIPTQAEAVAGQSFNC